MGAPSFSAGVRFELRRQLGAGGMGLVYEAYDRERGEVVALKTLQGARPEWLSRFKREFRSLHDLSHRNLVGLGEFFDGETEPFFTMELVEGVDLLRHVRPGYEPPVGADGHAETEDMASARSSAKTSSKGVADAPVGRCDETHLRDALSQLLNGLAALHEAGKVHCDIKPSNVLVEPSGRTVLLDFGLVADVRGDHAVIDRGLVGTVEYMAPEQALTGEPTPAVDVYSLGCVLFEALTGRLPYTAERPFELLMKKGEQAPAPLRELAPDAPADLAELCEAMLSREPGERPSVAAILARLGDDDEARDDGGRIGTDAEAVFVGRAAELGALRRMFDAGRARASMTVIEGRSGIGKSTLVERFVRDVRADHPGSVVLRSRCYERELVSYKAFDGIVEGLTEHLRRLPRAQREAVMPEQPALLARLFPVMQTVDVIGGAPPAAELADPQEQRAAMFDALRELLARVAEGERLVFFIDDLQWTDADSLALLRALVDADRPLSVFVVATMRPANVDARRELLARIESFVPLERLALTELGNEDARELVERLVPEAGASSAATIARSAGGNPLFLLELARHLRSEGSSDSQGSSLEHMLSVRLSRIPDDARAVLDVLAVAERPVALEVAAIAAGLTIARVVKAATILRAGHMARTDGVRRDDSIAPFHDRVRELVLEGLDDRKRRALHKRLAHALEQTGAAEAAPLVIVRHAEAAGRGKIAAAYAEKAARAASRALAFEQAAELFAKSLELGVFDDDKRRELLIEYAFALQGAGRGPASAAAFEEAAADAEHAVRLECQRHAAEQWLVSGHIDEGMAAMSASMREIGEPPAASPRRALAGLLWNRARVRARGLRSWRRRAQDSSAHTLSRLDVLRSLAIGLAMVDNIRGADFNARYLLAALDAADPHHLASAFGQELVFVASQLGRTTARMSLLQAELEDAAARCEDEAYARTWTSLSLGAAAFFTGRFREAAEELESAEDVFATATAGLTYEKNNVRVFRVHALRMLGGLREQRELIAGLVRAGTLRDDRYLVTTLRLLEVQSLLAVGEVAAARENVESSAWTPPGTDFHLQHWYQLIAKTEIALYEGRAATAVAELADSYAALERSMLLRVKLVRTEALVLRCRLLVAAARARGGEGPEAVQAGRLARRLERERTGYASIYAALTRAGVAAAATGRADRAVEQLRIAVELARARGMALHEAAARDALGRIIGGSEGAAERDAARLFGEAHGVVDLERLFQVAAPGLGQVARR